MNLIRWGARLRGDDQITARSTRDRIEEAGPLGCCMHVQNFGSVLAADCAGRLDTLNISELLTGNLSPSEQYISTNFLSTVYYHLYCKLFAMRVQKISCCRRLKSNSNCNPMGNVLYLHLVRMINSELSHSQHYISHHFYSRL